MAVLIIDNDADHVDLLCFLFRRDGYEVMAARDGAVGLKLFTAKEPQLVLLDVDLPMVDGWSVLRQIRNVSNTPVIILTATGDEPAIVQALDLGADDFVTKPFSPGHLLARVRAVLRRSHEATDAPRKGWQNVSSGAFRLDPQWRTVQNDRQTLRLTAIEFKLLYELMLHEGQVLTHQQLTDSVWGYEAVDDATLLKGHMRNLRKKLEPDPSRPVHLQTVVGVGYTFISRPAASPALLRGIHDRHRAEPATAR